MKATIVHTCRDWDCYKSHFKGDFNEALCMEEQHRFRWRPALCSLTYDHRLDWPPTAHRFDHRAPSFWRSWKMGIPGMVGGVVAGLLVALLFLWVR